MTSLAQSVDDLLNQIQRCKLAQCCEHKYHCPLCPPTFFKPSQKYKVEKHLKLSHWKPSLEAPDGRVSVICHLDHHPKSHYHCPGCEKLINRKSNFKHHLSICSEYIHITEKRTRNNLSALKSLSHDPPGETFEEQNSLVVPDHCYSIPKDLPTPAKKLCTLCGKLISSTWFSQHQKIHRTPCGISPERYHYSVLIDKANGIYTSSISLKGRQIPIHVQKVTHTTAKSQCEHKSCRELKNTAIRGGNISFECPHVLSVPYAVQGIIQSLSSQQLLETERKKLLTEQRCAEVKKLQVNARERGVPLAVKIPCKENTSCRYHHLSVFTDETKYWCLLQRTIVTIDTKTNSITCRCKRNSREHCVHKAVGKCFLTTATEHSSDIETSDSDCVTSADPVSVISQNSTEKTDPTVNINYLKSHKLTPPELPPDVVPKPGSTPYRSGSTIWPKEVTCFNCNGKLKAKIISKNSKVIYMFEVVSGIAVGAKTCPTCDIMYRYQEWTEGIHNYNNVTFLGMDLCRYIRAGLQNHVAIGRSVSIVQDLLGVKLDLQEINNAYIHFEAFSNHNYNFNCVLCGFHPVILIYDTCRKLAFRFAASDAPSHTSKYSETVNCEQFWHDVEADLLNTGFNKELKPTIKPCFDYWSPWVGVHSRRGEMLINSEHKKIILTTEGEEISDPVPEETLTSLLLDEKRASVKRVCQEMNVSSEGSVMDMILRLRKKSISRSQFDKAYGKIFGCSGGWAIGCCPHGIIYSMKSNLRAESPRDFLDLERSLKHRPNVTVSDVSYLLAKMGNRNIPDFYQPNEGRLAPISEETMKGVEDGTISYSLPFLNSCVKSSSSTSAHPITGSDHHLALTDWFHQQNCKKREEKLRWASLVDELCGVLDTQRVEQLFSSLKRDLYFLNNMGPSKHIFLFRLILHLRNEKANREVYNKQSVAFGQNVVLNEYGQITHSYFPSHQDPEDTEINAFNETVEEETVEEETVEEEFVFPTTDFVRIDGPLLKSPEISAPSMEPDSSTDESNLENGKNTKLAKVLAKAKETKKKMLSAEETDNLLSNLKYATDVIGLSCSDYTQKQVVAISTKFGWFQTQGSSSYCGLCCLNNLLGSKDGKFPVTISDMDERADNIWFDMMNMPAFGLALPLEPLRNRDGFYSVEVLRSVMADFGIDLQRLNVKSIANLTTKEVVLHCFQSSTDNPNFKQQAIVRLRSSEHWVALRYRQDMDSYLLLDSLKSCPQVVSSDHVGQFLRRNAEHPGAVFLLSSITHTDSQSCEIIPNQCPVSIQIPIQSTETNENDQTHYNFRERQERKRSSSWLYGYPLSTTHCICKKKDDGRLYWQCEGCLKWYHPDCIGLSPEHEPVSFTCRFCEERKGIKCQKQIILQSDPDAHFGQSLIPRNIPANDSVHLVDTYTVCDTIMRPLSLAQDGRSVMSEETDKMNSSDSESSVDANYEESRPKKFRVTKRIKSMVSSEFVQIPENRYIIEELPILTDADIQPANIMPVSQEEIDEEMEINTTDRLIHIPHIMSALKDVEVYLHTMIVSQDENTRVRSHFMKYPDEIFLKGFGFGYFSFLAISYIECWITRKFFSKKLLDERRPVTSGLVEKLVCCPGTKELQKVLEDTDRYQASARNRRLKEFLLRECMVYLLSNVEKVQFTIARNMCSLTEDKSFKAAVQKANRIKCKGRVL